MLIGVLGGGQLGQMLALAGIPLGLRFRFLNPAPKAPASAVGEVITGAFEDEAVLTKFAAGVDVVTYEFENVPAASVRWLAQRVPVYPPPKALEAGQDRLREKTLFRELGFAVHDFENVEPGDDGRAAIAKLGLPLVAKTRRMGYDGKGQMVLRTDADAARLRATLGDSPLLIERLVTFQRELSIIACRGRDGSCISYPLTENVHEGGILRISRAPAADISPATEKHARDHAQALMQRLNYVGVLAIELFDTGNELYANEMAPRVHNSGHWTIDGCEVSQFENHCRAVAGLPLGEPGVRGSSVMVNFIGAMPPAAELLKIPGVRVHDYGKEPRAGRKVGHATIVGVSAEERLHHVLRARSASEGHSDARTPQ
ncbi:MAG: 5-(carboxyamino)imidazole ribonucleotide synthase [Phycisphaerales bacterium]|jgi:5-(carboxyamino)imidazole ribonucleotide synthase